MKTNTPVGAKGLVYLWSAKTQPAFQHTHNSTDVQRRTEDVSSSELSTGCLHWGMQCNYHLPVDAGPLCPSKGSRVLYTDSYTASSLYR